MRKIVILVIILLMTPFLCHADTDNGVDGYSRTGAPPQQTLSQIPAQNGTDQTSEDIDGQQAYYLGVKAYNEGNYSEAVKQLSIAATSELTAENKKNVLIYQGLSYYQMGIASYNSGDYPVAIKQLGTALKFKLDDATVAWIKYYRGKAYYATGDNNKAVTDLRAAITKFPNWAMAYYIRGNAYFANGSYSLAEKDYASAIGFLTNNKAENTYADFAGWLKGYASNAVSNGQTAEMSLLAACYGGIGGVHMLQGFNDKAVKDFSNELAIKPQSRFAYFCRGKANLKLNKYPEAINDLTHAETLGEKSEELYLNRCSAYFKFGKYDNAKADIDKVIAMNPKNIAAYYIRAEAEMKMLNMNKAAINDYTIFINAKPNIIPAYLHRGICYLRAREDVKGLADINHAIEMDPEYPEGYYLRYQYYGMIKHDTDLAMKDYERYLELEKAMNSAQKKQMAEDIAIAMALYFDHFNDGI
ncbi:MAG: tetratricopeptide repeat protein [Negativicutes bacterium]|jgi:tetratricopeptide (TPR) repeat protein